VTQKKPNVDPKIPAHIWHACHEEWVTIVYLIKFHWIYVLVLVSSLIFAINYVRPVPRMQLTMATGQPNSSLDILGKKYQEIFKKNGVNLELINTAGAFENLELINQNKVDVGFSLGGIQNSDALNKNISLGSVGYQPIWLFYNGDEYADGSLPLFLMGKKFSVNVKGSGTQRVTEKFLSLYEMSLDNKDRFVELSSNDSVDALFAKKIDGMFLVAGVESNTFQRLIANPNIKIFNFTAVDAYAKRMKFLEVLQLPSGAIDLNREIPRYKTQLVATTTTIIGHEDLHPALQHLFLTTAQKIYQTEDSFFQRVDGFPAYIDRTVPVSSVAERFYLKGAPPLDEYVPFWISSLFDRMWFVLFALVAVIYPLKSFIPNYRNLYAQNCMTDCYATLAKLDFEIGHLQNKKEFDDKLNEFWDLELRVNHLWIPFSLRDEFYGLKNAIEIVRLKTETQRKHIHSKPNTELLTSS
jgi:uncharacterized protein